jgi:hypothetical protein
VSGKNTKQSALITIDDLAPFVADQWSLTAPPRVGRKPVSSLSAVQFSVRTRITDRVAEVFQTWNMPSGPVHVAFQTPTFRVSGPAWVDLSVSWPTQRKRDPITLTLTGSAAGAWKKVAA